MGPLDWVALLALLLGPALLGAWRSLRAKCRRRGRGPDDPGGVADDTLRDRVRTAASKSMGVVTVGLSLLASNLSGITLLGYPAEVYRYGSQFWMVAFGAVLATAALCAAYLPVLHGLQLKSSHEYLELRFDTRVRKLTSIVYTGRLLLLLPLGIYVPALAVNQVTGVGTHVIAPIVSLSCIVCTTLGGLGTVVLTGSLQYIVMLVALVALLAVGLADVGGLGVVWRRMAASGRIEFFNMDPDPLTRTTFWSATLGSAFFWLQMLAVQPNSVQRYLAVPTLVQARRTAYLQCVGLVVTTTLTCLLGATLYAKYDGCDPLRAGAVERADQLVALMVAQMSGRLPGMAGLFLAGLLSAAMGNLSAALNTLSNTLYDDLVSTWLPQRLQGRSTVVVRLLTLLIGTWATLLVFVVERLGGLVQVAMSLGGVTSGALLGLFTLGMLVRRANATGALVGASVSLLMNSVVVFGQQSAIATGALSWPTKPTNISECIDDSSSASSGAIASGEVLAIFRLSYLWLVLLGAAITVLVGTFVSLLSPGVPVDSALMFGKPCGAQGARRGLGLGDQDQMDAMTANENQIN